VWPTFTACAVVAPTLLDVAFIDDLQLPDNICLGMHAEPLREES